MLAGVKERTPGWGEYEVKDSWPLSYDFVQAGERVCLITLTSGGDEVQVIGCADWVHPAWGKQGDTTGEAAEDCLALLRGARG